jgi:AcrR family transcriptional regulator
MTGNAVATDIWVPARGGLPKAEQTRRTRELIVETGIRCLAQAGYANTTMMLISKEAGISRGPLHYHFADRHALMAAIAEALPHGVTDAMIRRFSAATTIGGRLDAIVDVALEQHFGQHHFAAMELLLAARNDAELSAAIRPHFLASEAVIDAWWIEYLALLRWPRSKLVAFRHVSVACLRGLALDQLLQGDDEAHRDALGLFREMFLAFAVSEG